LVLPKTLLYTTIDDKKRETFAWSEFETVYKNSCFDETTCGDMIFKYIYSCGIWAAIA
jgi:hypothetical protein